MGKKLKLDLGELEVQVFSVPESYENVRGTVKGQSVWNTECSNTDCTCGIGNTCGTQETCANTCGTGGDTFICTTGCDTIYSTNCPRGSNCEPFTDCAGCTSEWLCGGTAANTCQGCATQTPGDTVCYDTITCCES
jgi:hypothetical protein